ncbi:hypothetical protein RSSM_01827 [Rhodopirellula sallentina SM41]|uniref:Uncharacterized protein n=1 Tax=Rhodopirellula sallentina SM41 TaxID=1263870 RepID=M5U5K9_9BACT|nr:hypothetical protein RSSM_01827 [Rhodopirellula sallentina SM41]
MDGDDAVLSTDGFTLGTKLAGVASANHEFLLADFDFLALKAAGLNS